MLNPKWKELTELLGIIAIVISMAAVAYELRQTQSALNASTYQERAIDAIGEFLVTSDSEFLLPILVTTKHGADQKAVAALNDIDRGRLFHWLRARMVDWDNEYYQYTQGYLDEDFFRTTTEPAVKKFAPRWRAIGLTEPRKEFSNFVDKILAEKTEEQ